jgi:hypothetical protein
MHDAAFAISVPIIVPLERWITRLITNLQSMTVNFSFGALSASLKYQPTSATIDQCFMEIKGAWE